MKYGRFCAIHSEGNLLHSQALIQAHTHPRARPICVSGTRLSLSCRFFAPEDEDEAVAADEPLSEATGAVGWAVMSERGKEGCTAPEDRGAGASPREVGVNGEGFLASTCAARVLVAVAVGMGYTVLMTGLMVLTGSTGTTGTTVAVPGASDVRFFAIKPSRWTLVVGGSEWEDGGVVVEEAAASLVLAAALAPEPCWANMFAMWLRATW